MQIHIPRRVEDMPPMVRAELARPQGISATTSVAGAPRRRVALRGAHHCPASRRCAAAEDTPPLPVRTSSNPAYPDIANDPSAIAAKPRRFATPPTTSCPSMI